MKKVKSKIKEVGFKNFIICVLKRLTLFKFLRWYYKLHEWFFTAGVYECNKYQQTVAAFANKLKPKVVIDIGCGIGEIISRIKADVKIGVDIDETAIEVARKLNILRRDNTVYVKGSFDILEKYDRIDLVIITGFLFGIHPEELNKLIPLLKDKAKYIIVDEIDKEADSTGYPYKHDFDALFGSFAENIMTSELIKVRRIKVYRNKNAS